MSLEDMQSLVNMTIVSLKMDERATTFIPYSMRAEFKEWVFAKELPVDVTDEYHWAKKYAPGDLIKLTIQITSGETRWGTLE